ncbi:ABC transporter ATP-binding protein [Actinorugispora endophytica]|uniref:ABC-2 type transport system ATP-binding protein/lipooligosaccharide transport system ATP-binding protein n=1 Tax=Actinorugispora endophytica TaxID=1605990 RepID=A0A4R6VCV8_9ACTN|nr:ABC transporter ATP-binding protein [Actinorugispora endophytica]TDQ54807.1 ABC-2 type transport system ATP-binding protein/lipooligosaccharide transport system ATP-binding protein [Actinorugispora endophytica]
MTSSPRLNQSTSEPSRSQSPPAISLRGVVKRFGSLTAVDGLDLDVPEGIVLGLLGPNGAGKSTTMRMLTAQSRADSGQISILGHRIPQESKWARSLMGVVPQHDNLDEELTVEENLRVFTHLYRVPRGERAAAVERALDLAHLRDRRTAFTGKLSGGMRRRLLIARGLVHRPQVVLLDEPTVGLDPQVRQELWGLITALRADGVTVLMSTHYIEEAERLSDEVALMAKGRIVNRGAPADLIAEFAGKTVEEYAAGPDGIEELERTVHAEGFTTRRTGSALSVLRAEELPDSLRDRLGTGTRRAGNLEDVFVTLTGEKVE